MHIYGSRLPHQVPASPAYGGAASGQQYFSAHLPHLQGQGLYKLHQPGTPQPRHDHTGKETQKAFDLLDMNKDGQITKPEALYVCRHDARRPQPEAPLPLPHSVTEKTQNGRRRHNLKPRNRKLAPGTASSQVCGLAPPPPSKVSRTQTPAEPKISARNRTTIIHHHHHHHHH